MKDLQSFISESLLGGYEDIESKIDVNVFSPIYTSKSIKEFNNTIENILSVCEKVNMNDLDFVNKHKRSFFIAPIYYMNGKSAGIVIDKMLKKSASSIKINASDFVSDINIYTTYYPSEKIDICRDAFFNYDGANFDTYLVEDIYIMPKEVEKLYINFIKNLHPTKIKFAYQNRFAPNGEQLIRKIS